MSTSAQILFYLMSTSAQIFLYCIWATKYSKTTPWNESFDKKSDIKIIMCCDLAESMGSWEHWWWDTARKRNDFFLFSVVLIPTFSDSSGVFSKMYLSTWALQSSGKLKTSHVQLQTDFSRSHHICEISKSTLIWTIFWDFFDFTPP